MTTPRAIPTKEQVLEAASKCPETKEALKILFPEDFKEDFKVDFDWMDFSSQPFSDKYLVLEGPDRLRPTKELLDAYESIGYHIPGSSYPSMSLIMVGSFFQFLVQHYEGKDL